MRRGKIPKTQTGEFWHWKDLAVGKDIPIYGIVYHTVDCDTFTRVFGLFGGLVAVSLRRLFQEYMQSQGLLMGEAEETPPDPYIQERAMHTAVTTSKTPAADDKLRRFLEYDGKILK